MSGTDEPSNPERAGKRFLFSRFVFQAGLGALIVSLAWVYLSPAELLVPERGDLLPLILFGVALPWLAVGIPAHIVSSATASGRFLTTVSVVLALLAVAASLGMLVFSRGTVFVVVLTGSIASVGVLAQSLWGRLFGRAVSGGLLHREGILTYGGWLSGVAIASATGLLGRPHYGLWLGAGALLIGGWLVQFVPRKNSSANWLSNRSALRLFAAIENAFRSDRQRAILVRAFWYSGASLALLAMIPGEWVPVARSAPAGDAAAGISSLGLAAVVLAMLTGMALGSVPGIIALAARKPGLILFIVCLTAPIAALGVARLPDPAKAFLALALVLGAGWGLVLGAASRDLRKLAGPGFAMESEVLLLTVIGGGGVVFCACFWLAREIFDSGLFLVIAEFLIFTSFALFWRRRWVGGTDPSDSAIFDPWYPGKFENPAGEADSAILISVTYEIPEERREQFADAIEDLAHLRQKQGALYWTLTESLENPGLLNEQFIIESPDAYQEAVRTEREKEREIKQRVFNLNHWDSLPCETHDRLLEA